MINPKRAAEIGRPFGIEESDISQIGKAAAIARIIRFFQLTLPVIAVVMGVLAGKYAFPTPQQSSGYPYSMASMAILSASIADRRSWKGVTIVTTVAFVAGFVAQLVYSATRPESPAILYGVHSR